MYFNSDKPRGTAWFMPTTGRRAEPDRTEGNAAVAAIDLGLRAIFMLFQKRYRRDHAIWTWQYLLDRVSVGIHDDTYQPVASANDQCLRTMRLIARRRVPETGQRNGQSQCTC